MNKSTKLFSCFIGFNQTVIVLRYSAHINQCKTIKTFKAENITHKHTMMLTINSVVTKLCCE